MPAPSHVGRGHRFAAYRWCSPNLSGSAQDDRGGLHGQAGDALERSTVLRRRRLPRAGIGQDTLCDTCERGWLVGHVWRCLACNVALHRWSPLDSRLPFQMEESGWDRIVGLGHLHRGCTRHHRRPSRGSWASARLDHQTGAPLTDEDEKIVGEIGVAEQGVPPDGAQVTIGAPQLNAGVRWTQQEKEREVLLR